MTSSSGSSKVICKVWKHSWEDRPDMEIDVYGRVLKVISKNPPYRYVISYEYEGDLYTQEVLAMDELDAVKQFLQEK